MRTRTPTRLVDVAREAGVHVSTVSRVLNARDEAAVRPETRDRILDTAERMRYRPNALARGLKTATTTTFGMLVPSLRNPCTRRSCAARSPRPGGGATSCCSPRTTAAVTEQAWERLVDEGRIDGILVAERRAGEPDPGTRRGEPRAVRVREPARAGQRPQRLDARGGCGAHRRRAPARARATCASGRSRARSSSTPRGGAPTASPRPRLAAGLGAAGDRRVALPGGERVPRDRRAAGLAAARPDRHLHLEPEPGDRRARRRAPPGPARARGRLARLATTTIRWPSTSRCR